MSKIEHTDDLEAASPERRQFLRASAKYGVTTALVAASAGTLMSDKAQAFTAKEEKERKEKRRIEKEKEGLFKSVPGLIKRASKS